MLVSLGHPDQQPPPVIELLLTDPTALLAADAGAGAIGTSPAGDDALGRLERDLRDRVGAGSVGGPGGEPAPDPELSTAAGVAVRGLDDPESRHDELRVSVLASARPEAGQDKIEASEAKMLAGRRQGLARTDPAVIADLEAWLDALARDRAATLPP